MKKSEYSIQSNDITTARNLLNVYERRIINAVIYNVSERIKAMAFHKVQAINYYQQPGDPSSLVMEFRASELGVPAEKYGELREALMRLKTTGVYLETKRGTRITGFLNWGEFPERSAIITVSVDMVFYERLCDLNNGYTIFQAAVIYSLTSVHATKIYELLAKYRDKEFFRMTLDELKWMTNCQEKYPAYADFKRKVIEAAKRQLDKNEITDLRFRYSEIRNGKKVTGIQFHVLKTENAYELAKVRNSLSPHWDFTKDLVENARNIGLNIKGKNLELLKEYKAYFGENVLAEDLKRFYDLSRTKNLGIGYVIGCLRKKYVDHTQTKISFVRQPEEKRYNRVMKLEDLLGKKG